MFIATTSEIPGHEVQAVHGFVSGAEVRAKNMIRDVGASLKGLVGGELKSYSALMDETRSAALARLVKAAEAAGANAVVAVRMTSGQIAQTAAEVYAYGTAVSVTPLDERETAAESSGPDDGGEAVSG